MYLYNITIFPETTKLIKNGLTEYKKRLQKRLHKTLQKHYKKTLQKDTTKTLQKTLQKVRLAQTS